jgi:hypothetical protein
VPELPIVAEVSNWGAFILGAMLIVGAVAVVRAAWRLDSLKRIAGLAGSLIPLVLGLVLTLQNVGWQLRIDQKGIALRAPFDPLWPSGEIGWPDVTAVDIMTHWYRDAPYYILRIRGQRGVELLIASADQIPPQFIAQLQAVVAKLAPQVTDIKELDREFQYAREHSSSVIYNSYAVRDGRGVLLR